MLIKGQVFNKTPPTLGTIKKRFVRLTADKRAVVWYPERGQQTSDNYLPIEEIVQVSRGQNTEPFRKYGDPAEARLSFSICATSRTVDLAAPSDKVLKDWIIALEALLIFIPRKYTPQDKRKEQRKNDKVEEKAHEIFKKKKRKEQNFNRK